jgi:hypothetical protein
MEEMMHTCLLTLVFFSKQVIQLKQEKGMEEMKRLEAESALKV